MEQIAYCFSCLVHDILLAFTRHEKQNATLQAVDENRNTCFLLSLGDSFTHFLSHFLLRVAQAQNTEIVKLNTDLGKKNNNNNNNFTFKQAAADVTS